MKHQVADWLDVSRETIEELEAYEGLVRKWNPTVNLVAKNSLDQIWERHILDSAQIWSILREQRWSTWLDLGSGGGFPGLVVGILAKAAKAEGTICLIESDRRKSVFLTEVARQLQLGVSVIAERIEMVTPRQADVVSARALASLSDLCGFAVRHLRSDGVALFMKGRGFEAELEHARTLYHFDLRCHASRTDAEAAILELRNIRHV